MEWSQALPLELQSPRTRHHASRGCCLWWFETLERLLAVPAHHDVRSEAERTDEFLAVVIEQSLPASLARPSAFRKRNLDLFRTEREIEVGRQEMLVRLRLRAKSRETMSVEFRF